MGNKSTKVFMDDTSINTNMLKGQKRPPKGHAKTPKQIRRAYQQSHKGRLKSMLYDARARAKHLQLPCTITVEDIVIPEFCPVFGTPLVFGKGKPTDNSPTIDRIDISKGYTKDNICVISYKANRIKNNSTLPEIKAILGYMVNHIKFEDSDYIHNFCLESINELLAVLCRNVNGKVNTNSE